MPVFGWELYRDGALASCAVSKHAQKTADWIKLVKEVHVSSTKEKSLQLKGRGCRVMLVS